MKKTLVIGALGQIGKELTEALRLKYGKENVIAADVKEISFVQTSDYPYEQLDVLDKDYLQEFIRKEKVQHIYMLAAILSASGEKEPLKAWDLNTQGLLNVLDTAVAENVERVFWPSSIAVFGPNSPKENCPQDTVMQPTTVYGISKSAGENWCNYYHQRYGLDVRSIRYPGLISYKALPGGGSTDYAVDIYHSAVKEETYHCFLKEHTPLPMMYMPDAIRATISLMEAPSEKLTIRTSYNLAGITFTPAEIAASIRKFLPNFTIVYEPDFRQSIAETWPHSINDIKAKEDWAWENEYLLDEMTKDMLANLAICYHQQLILED